MSDYMTTFEVPLATDGSGVSGEVALGFNHVFPHKDHYSIFMEVANSEGDNAWLVLNTATATRLRDHLNLLLEKTA